MIINNEIDCIVQDGIKYCERNSPNNEQIGYGLLASLVIILWTIFWLNQIVEEDRVVLSITVGFILPVLAVSLGLIFLK